jgi:formylmethanofuran dehydrogenase subunit E
MEKNTTVELACDNCGDDTEDYLTKYGDNYWLCDICAKENN